MTKRRRAGIAQTIGGVLVGFDQQVLRNRPPAEELVHHARPDDPVPARDGGGLVVSLPADVVAEREPDDEPRRD